MTAAKRRAKRTPPPPPPTRPVHTTCPECGAPVVLARADMVSNLWHVFDNVDLTSAGELDAQGAGRFTVTVHRCAPWPELRTFADVASFAPAARATVAPVHACGAPELEHTGPAWPSPPDPTTAPPASTEPPF